MTSPVCAGDDPMQLTGSPCCSGAVTLAFQIRLLHTGAITTSATNETPAMLNLRLGLLPEHEKPDNCLHPWLLMKLLMSIHFIVSATLTSSQWSSIKIMGGSSQNCAQHICIGLPDY